MNRLLGWLIQFWVVATTIDLWVLSKENAEIIIQFPIQSISQVVALVGFVLIAFNLVLTTRWNWVENLFGGLDRVYFKHHMLGGIAFVLVMNHPILLAVSALPQTRIAQQYLIPGKDLSLSLGVVGLYLMIIAFVFMVLVRIPYQGWLKSHRLLAVGFLLVSGHLLLINSDVSNSIVLRVWMIGWAVVGNLAAGYKIIAYNKWGPWTKYRVEKVERVLDIVQIYLKPKDQEIKYRPGQFAYVTIENKALGKEAHPYSFSSYGEEGIRFAVKALGDYTLKLTGIKNGETARVAGPYGRFGEKFWEGKEEMVWIGGGIGITPFLSMLDYEVRQPKARRIDLVYCYSDPNEGVFKEEIEKKTKGIKQIFPWFWCSQEQGRMSIKGLRKIFKLEHQVFLICGPEAMRENLKSQLLDEGVAPAKIITENFNLI